MSPDPRVSYQTHPSRCRHWNIDFDGAIATLAADFDENAGLRPGYKLKLNSYDLGVDIELNDAVNRIRFEHPEVRTVVITSDKDRVFCSGGRMGRPCGRVAAQRHRPPSPPSRCLRRHT